MTPTDHAARRARAEALYESLGGDLCVCQRPDVHHWCETCQARILLILAAFAAEADLTLSEKGPYART